MPKTKIICTLGPSTAREDIIRRLIYSGMDCARLNFSHGTIDSHFAMIKAVRSASKKTGRHTAVLQDLPGPKLRIGKLQSGSLKINAGAEILLSHKPAGPHAGSAVIPFHLPSVIKSLKPGDDIFLSDGAAHLKALKAAGSAVLCRAVNNCVIRSNCGINIPNAAIALKAFTDRDRLLLKAGIDAGVDAVAVSFVSGKEDISSVRRMLRRFGASPLVIAKIERRLAMENLREIVKESDMVMVARGDLGVELPLEKVPFAQKEITAECRRQGKPSIVATQMLESMVNSPSPTRAELADIANAVLDGADAVMLSAETSIGKYPSAAVRILAKVLLQTERHIPPCLSRLETQAGGALSASIAVSAAELAHGIGAKAVILPVFSGETLRMISQMRLKCPVVAICRPGNESRFSMFHGVTAIAEKNYGKNLAVLIKKAKKAAQKLKFAKKGDTAVIACSIPQKTKDISQNNNRIIAAVRL